jgi:hypothetical protein
MTEIREINMLCLWPVPMKIIGSIDTFDQLSAAEQDAGVGLT